MHYWIVDIKYKKHPLWKGMAIVQGGRLRDHLLMLTALRTDLEEINDLRIRPVTVDEAQCLTQHGMMMWVRVGEQNE